MLATLLLSASGIAGGIFAPSLAPHSAIILLTMAAYLSGVTRAPVTSFIIMMEMTDSHQMLLPLMTALVAASACSRIVCNTQLYHSLADNFPSLLPQAGPLPPLQACTEQESS